jgi:hypothetical protein
MHDDQYRTGDDAGKAPQDRAMMYPVGAGRGRLRRDHMPCFMFAALGVRLRADGDLGCCSRRKVLLHITLMTTDGPPDLITAVE